MLTITHIKPLLMEVGTHLVIVVNNVTTQYCHVPTISIMVRINVCFSVTVPIQKKSEILRTVLLGSGIKPGRPRCFQEISGSVCRPLLDIQ